MEREGREASAPDAGRVGEVAGVPLPRLLGALAFLLAGLAAFLLSGLASRWPEFVEAVFVRGWAEAVVPPFSRLTGAVPIPVLEALAVGYLGFRLWTSARAGRAVAAGDRRAGSTLLSGLAVALRDVGAAVLLFYLLWGFHYARPPAAARLSLPEVGEVSDAELVRLSGELAAAGNAAYRALHGTDDAGTPTEMPREWDGLRAALQEGWRRAGDRLPLGPLVTARFGPPKPLLSSPLLAHLGITGFYSPFTAEALLVGTTPAVSLGLSLAHEEAHQRGITNEGEATFLGFVAAMESGASLLRYSAAVRARSRILSVLARRDTTAVRPEMEEWLPGVLRDLEDLRAYRRRHRGPPARLATRVNDAYLRANRVPGGIESYVQATRLLLRYARLRGGSLLADEPGSHAGADTDRSLGPAGVEEPGFRGPRAGS